MYQLIFCLIRHFTVAKFNKWNLQIALFDNCTVMGKNCAHSAWKAFCFVIKPTEIFYFYFIIKSTVFFRKLPHIEILLCLKRISFIISNLNEINGLHRLSDLLVSMCVDQVHLPANTGWWHKRWQEWWAGSPSLVMVLLRMETMQTQAWCPVTGPRPRYQAHKSVQHNVKQEHQLVWSA